MVNPFSKKAVEKKKAEINTKDLETLVDETVGKKQAQRQTEYKPISKETQKKIDKSKLQTVKIVKEKPRIDMDKAILWLSVLGIVGVIFLYQMVESFNSGLALLLWLFGMMCFLPMGLILGWFFLDPYMRCKIMRRTRHKNYGIIYFVHKGGKRITTRIKNLDDDVIVNDTKLWLIDKGGVYYIDVNGNKQ